MSVWGLIPSITEVEEEIPVMAMELGDPQDTGVRTVSGLFYVIFSFSYF